MRVRGSRRCQARAMTPTDVRQRGAADTGEPTGLKRRPTDRKATIAPAAGDPVIDHYLDARAELIAPGAPFAITTIEVRGVPVRTFANMPSDMRVVWESTAGHGDKQYVVFEDERYTYAEI